MTTAEKLDLSVLSDSEGAKVQRRQRGSCSLAFWGVFGAILVLALTRAFTTGNPSQHVDRLWKVMREGMAGGEHGDALDSAYVGVNSNDEHKGADEAITNSFYNLASDFYEYGWGESFHFGWRRVSEGHGVAIQNAEWMLAAKLQVGDMDRVADFGCGVGGPLRSVVRKTGANVTGITINHHQVRRAREITAKEPKYVQDRAQYIQQNFLHVTDLEPNSFDAVFYMETSLHVEDRAQTFKQAYKVLKPGGRVVAFEYNLLPGWDPENKEHQQLMAWHLYGNGAARTPTIEENLAQFREAGFEIVEHFDACARGDESLGDDAMPWWMDLQWNWRFHLLPAHPAVRGPLTLILKALSSIGLVPEDVYKASHLLNIGADGLSGLGKVGAITPQYLVVAVKPLDA